MNLDYIRDRIRVIDPEANIVEHPTILYAYRVTCSMPLYLGYIIKEVESERLFGIYIAYNFRGKDNTVTFLVDIEPKKLTWYQRFLRRLAGLEKK